MFLPFSLILLKSKMILILILIIIIMMILIFTVISYWLGTFCWVFVCLFVFSNRFLIPMHDSMIIKISILPAWLCCFLCHFYNNTELGLLFQSINHSFRSSSSLLLPMTQRSHIEHSQMTMIAIYQSKPKDGLN